MDTVCQAYYAVKYAAAAMRRAPNRGLSVVSFAFALLPVFTQQKANKLRYEYEMSTFTSYFLEIRHKQRCVRPAAFAVYVHFLLHAFFCPVFNKNSYAE